MSFTSATASQAEPTATTRRHDLGIVVAARSAGLLGDEVAVVALTLRLHDQGGPPWLVAVLLAAGALPLALAAPLAGRLVDRRDSRGLLVGCGAVQAVLCLALAVVSGTTAVIALVAALAAVEAVAAATWQALLPRISGDEQLGRATSYVQAGGTLASIAGPAVAGVLSGAFGTRVPLVFDAVTFAVVALAALALRTRRRVDLEGGATDDASAWAGLRSIRRDPVLAPLVAGLTVFILVGLMVNVVEVFLVRDTLGAGSGWYGALVAAWAVGLLAGSLVAGRLTSDLARVRAVAWISVVLGAALASFAVTPSVVLLVVPSLVGGVANGVLNVGVGTLLMTRTPEHLRGRVAAAMTAIVSSASVASLLAGGALAAVLSPRTVFALAGGLAFAAAALSAPRAIRAVRRG